MGPLRAGRRRRRRGETRGRRTKGRAPTRAPIGSTPCSALYQLFNEGYWSGDDEAPVRADLCALAVGLARSLAEVATEAPEVRGLLALLLLHDARRPA